MKTYSGLGTVAAVCVLSGCVRQAAPPVIVPSADQGTREQLYEDYSLTSDIGFFAATWKRGDGEYAWGGLEELAKTYPSTKDVFDRAQGRALTLGAIGGTGGGIVGATLGWNLTANSDQRWSSGTQVALYSTGGGLIVLSLVLGAVWHNPALDFADVYNAALRQQLGVAPRGPSARAFELRPMRDGYGFTF